MFNVKINFLYSFYLKNVALDDLGLNFHKEKILSHMNEAPKRILVVFGTRPEAIKMCPVMKELKKRSSFDVKICSTGQHDFMLNQVLEIFDVKPDYNLNIMQEAQTLFDITTTVLNKISDVFQVEKPDLVLVHGDTSTSFTTALAAFYCNIPVGHVEAGLRTYDLQQPYPEEFNRQAISIIAQYNFAPTNHAKINLGRNNNLNTNTYIVGNTVIDALKTTVQKDFKSKELDWAKGHKLIFLTMHRREN